jgi:hypothetical protein
LPTSKHVLIFGKSTAARQIKSRVQPQAIMKPLFSSTIHLINLRSISIELKGRGIPHTLCCFWAFIYVSIHEGKFFEIIAQLAKVRMNLAAYLTPNEANKILVNKKIANAICMRKLVIVCSSLAMYTI